MANIIDQLTKRTEEIRKKATSTFVRTFLTHATIAANMGEDYIELVPITYTYYSKPGYYEYDACYRLALPPNIIKEYAFALLERLGFEITEEGAYHIVKWQG